MFGLKIAFRPWRAQPWSQVLSSFMVALLLVLSGLLFWVGQSLTPVISRLDHEQVISAYVLPEITSEQLPALADTLKLSLGAASRDVQVEVVDAPKFLEKIEAQDPQLHRELNALGPEASLLIPRYVSLSGVLSDSAVQALEQVAGVESVDSSRDRNRTIVGAFRAIQWISRALLVGLVFSLAVGFVHLCRTHGYLQQDAVAVLKAWGGDEWHLKQPGMLSGVLVGALGGLIAAIVWALAIAPVTGQLQALSPWLQGVRAPSSIWALAFVWVGGLMGLLSGFFAASLPGRTLASR